MKGVSFIAATPGCQGARGGGEGGVEFACVSWLVFRGVFLLNSVVLDVGCALL